jgi:hypothetical protein
MTSEWDMLISKHGFFDVLEPKKVVLSVAAGDVNEMFD